MLPKCSHIYEVVCSCNMRACVRATLNMLFRHLRLHSASNPFPMLNESALPTDLRTDRPLYRDTRTQTSQDTAMFVRTEDTKGAGKRLRTGGKVTTLVNDLSCLARKRG